MRYNSFEVNYLISLISSTLNKRVAPYPARFTQWRDLYYLAEYHDISNIAYYALIGVYDHVPEVWRNRFAKIFRKWVTISNIQEKELSVLKDALEDESIDFMFLKEWEIKKYYPQWDIRAVEDVEILIRPGGERDVKWLMNKLGYHREDEDENGTLVYHKSVRFRIIFRQKIFSDNRKIYSYFEKTWKRARSAVGFGTRYALGVDDFYIYMIADTCDTYARGDVDARHILDIFLYLKKNREQMNQTYIDTELGKLEFAKMAKCLEDVGALWLGVYEGDAVRQCRDVEEYIWSKGAYGRETSCQLLPMIQDMEVWQIHDARKKRMLKILHWFFPKVEQMKGRYPILRRSKALLPLFWIIRLLTMAGFLIKIRCGRLYRLIMLKLNKRRLRRKKHFTDRMEAAEEPFSSLNMLLDSAPAEPDMTAISEPDALDNAEGNEKTEGGPPFS